MPYVPNLIDASALTGDSRSTIATTIANDLGLDAPVIIPNDVASLHAFGHYICDTSARANSFLSAILNKIVLTVYTSRSYTNPLAPLKKGILETGESVEEIFINLQNGVQEKLNLSNADGGHSDPLNANIPDVKVAYHLTNVKAKYSKAIRMDELRQAFNSFNGLADFIAKLVEGVYNEANFDEYLVMKYKLAQAVLSAVKAGRQEDIASGANATEAEKAKAVLKKARKTALLLPTYKDGYNEAGVLTVTPSDKLVIFLPAEAEANIDIEALASAFNLTYAEFIGRRISIDNFTFTATEKSRIESISGLAPGNFPITSADMELLDGVQCVLADENLIQFYDTIAPFMAQNYNGADDVMNNWLHVKKVASISPYSNCVAITDNGSVDVTNTLTHATSDNAATSAVKYKPYKETITVASGYVINGAGSAATLTIGGVTKTSSYLTKAADNKSVVIDIPAAAVTDDIVVTVTAVSAG